MLKILQLVILFYKILETKVLLITLFLNLELTIEASEVSKMPLGKSILSRLGGDAPDVQRRCESQELLFTLVDDWSCHSPVNSQCKVLLDGQQFYNVVLAVCHHLKTKTMIGKRYQINKYTKCVLYFTWRAAKNCQEHTRKHQSFYDQSLFYD